VPTRPVPTRPAALLPPSPAPVALPPGRTREEWLALAERDQRVLQQEPRARYTIQLELVCELPSLEEAWRYDRRGAMWLASAEHRGRPCFRVFWGRYASLDEARRATESVPRFFFTPTNRPTVVSTRAALLP
jgi:septal ring-binding cell division protein DamX